MDTNSIKCIEKQIKKVYNKTNQFHGEIIMLVAICDDEQRENDNLRGIIEQYAFQKNYDISVTECNSGEELLQKEEKADFYILDYFMGGLNGVETAKKLKEKWSGSVTIAFLTSYESAAAEVINSRVYADGFLTKPVDTVQLEALLDRFYSMSFFNRLTLKKGGSFCTVYPRDLIYIESSGKKSVFHFFDSVEEYPYMLTELEEEILPPQLFFRIHRCYIINMLHIKSSAYDTVELTGGVTLPLKKPKEFRQAYNDFNFAMSDF